MINSKKVIFTVLVVLGVVLIAGWFYWFQFRPSQIRSVCNAEALEIVTDRYGVSWLKYDYAYKACLNEKGLK